MADQREGWWAYFNGDRPVPAPLTTMTKESHIPLPAVDVEDSGYELDDLALYHALQDELNGVNNEPSRPLLREQALQSINPDLIPALPSVGDSSFNLGDWVVESYFDSASQAESEASLPGFSGLDAPLFSDSVYSAQPAAATLDVTTPAPAPVNPVLASQPAPLVPVRLPVSPLLAYSPTPMPAPVSAPAPVQASPQAAHRVSASRAVPRAAPRAVPRAATTQAALQATPQASTRATAAPLDASVHVNRARRTVKNVSRAGPAPSGSVQFAVQGPRLAASVPRYRVQRTAQDVPRVTPAPGPSSVPQDAAQDARLAAPVSLDHVQAVRNARMDVSAPTPVGSAQFTTGQNDALGAPVSVSVGSAQSTARNVPLAVSATVPVDSAQVTGRDGPLDVSAFGPVGSVQSPGSTPLAASVPWNLVELASLRVALDNHPLENVNFSLESVASFASTRHTDTLMYSSCEEALTDHRPSELPEDVTVPRNTATKKVYVWLLCVALQTVQFAVDGFSAKFEQLSSSGPLVELRAWQMLERLIDNPSAVSGRRGRLYGTFLERFQATFTALMRRKNISKRVLEAPFLETFLENPLTHDSRASSNKKVNDRKSAQIAAGKAALAAVEGENEEPIETPAPATPRGKQAQLPTPPNSNEAATPTARGSRKRKADCRVGDARKRLGLKPASMNSG